MSSDGLTRLAEEEDAMSAESNDDGVPTNVDIIAAGNKGGVMVSKEKDEVPRKRGDQGDVGECERNGQCVWTSLLGNVITMYGRLKYRIVKIQLTRDTI